ncbi:hypothetical protein [Pseudorhodoplanes sp.]|uniref:hypothetical protein n=1 Tax=Pseudorhodoplanes sp. TaxID=1934341 RepID=UPI003D09926C
MSESSHILRNDPSSQIEDAASRIWGALQSNREGNGGELSVSDEAVARLLTAAIKLYYAKTDGEDRTFRPLMGERDEYVCATEVITAATELLRAMSLSPMELALWWRRRPDDAGFTSGPHAEPATRTDAPLPSEAQDSGSTS